MNFVALDFETANHQRHSRCSLRLTIVKNVVCDPYYHINKTRRQSLCETSKCMGIHPETFVMHLGLLVLGKNIKPCFKENKLIVLKPAIRRGVFNKTLDYTPDLNNPHPQDTCTVQSSRKLLTELPNH